MTKNISQIGQQLLAIWKQLGLNQRISIVLATLGVIGGLAGISYFSSRVDYARLYGRLDDGEASKVVAALDEMKVPYQMRGGAIMVPADKVYQVRMQMAGKGIPRGEGVGFEIFDKANFGISDFVQRANYTRAIQGELARTIGQLDQVDSARVMIVMPENRLLNDATRKPTASVFVRVRGNGQLPVSAVNSIRFLVANSVEGLQANNVSVVDNAGNVLSENQENDSIASLSGNQLSARRNFESYLTKKAEGMLETVLGPGQAVVRVSADINWDSITRTETKFDPDGQVAKSSTINDENTDTSAPVATAGGAPGVGANGAPADSGNGNGGTNTVVAAVPANSNHTHKKVTTSSYEISSTINNISQAAGGLKRLSTAVFIAQKFEGKGKDRKPVPRTPDELQHLRKIVQSALGIVENDPARKDELTLEEIAFNDQPMAELNQQFDQQQKREYYKDIGVKAGYLVLPAIALFMFWRLFKTTKGIDIPIGVPIGNGSTNGNGHSNGNGNGHYGRPAPNVVTVDVLNQLIRENPANMSNAVRSWLARGKS